MRLRLLWTTLAIGIAPMLPGTLFAQVRTVDEGTFMLSRNGTPAGRELFRIIRTPSAAGEVYRATAQVSVGERRVVPALSTDSLGSAISYEVAVRDGAESTGLQARARPGRLSALVRTPHGESAKEYVVQQNAVILDGDLMHQLFFVTLGNRRSGPITVVDPRAGNQTTVMIENRGAESIDVGGKAIATTHFVLSPSAAAGVKREFWIDSAGRVIKASSPDHGLTALRDEPPR
jgi:hypothetical protein